MQTEKNEHFASMRRTGRETALFALFAAIAAMATTLVAVAPARAAEPAAAQAATAQPATDQLARGEYLVRITGCNDCHTAGYAQAGGKVPTAQWLTGVSVGYQGAWGVSYPANLRLSLHDMGEAQWLVAARAPRLPPMPWFDLRDMSDADLMAIYAFVRSLGPAGERAPVALAPGAPVSTPVIVFEPRMPEQLQVQR